MADAIQPPSRSLITLAVRANISPKVKHYAGLHIPGGNLLPPAELATAMNEVEGSIGGFASSIGIVFDTVTADTVTATLEVQPRHLQPMGIVHGGVWMTMAETLASVGTAVSAVRAGQAVVGMENRTSFIGQARTGIITGVARALHRDASDHLWSVEMRDANERLIAEATVRLLILDSRDRTSADNTPAQG